MLLLLVKELCIRRPRRKKKDPPIINVVGQLADLMLGKAFTPKYADPGSAVVDFTYPCV